MNVKNKIIKLLKIHESAPNTPEGENAKAQARRLMAKHGFEEKDFYRKKKAPQEPRRVFPGRPSRDPMFEPVLRPDGPSYEPESFDDAVDDIVDAFGELFKRK